MKEQKPRCKHLRTRMAYLPEIAGLEHWSTGESTIDQYWCLCTMTTAGPDDQYVAPEKCQPGRSCYEDADNLV